MNVSCNSHQKSTLWIYLFYRRRSFSILWHFEQKLPSPLLPAGTETCQKKTNKTSTWIPLTLGNDLFSSEFAISDLCSACSPPRVSHYYIKGFFFQFSASVFLFLLSTPEIYVWYQHVTGFIVFHKSSSICLFLPQTAKIYFLHRTTDACFDLIFIFCL